MPRTRSRAASVNSDDLDGDTPTTTSSAKAVSRGRASTAKSTPATSAVADSGDDGEATSKSAKRVTRSASSKAPQVVAKKGRAASKAAPSKKRSRRSTEDENDEEDDGDKDDEISLAGSKADLDDNPDGRASKRRVVSSSFYIEIPLRRSSSQLDVKGKGKAKGAQEPKSTTSSAKTSPSSRASSRYQAKGKNNARKPRTSGASSTTEFATDASELDYDEHIDESSSSASSSGDEGSVFEASEDEEDDDVVLMGPSAGALSDEDDFEEVPVPSKTKGKGKAKAAPQSKRRKLSSAADEDEDDDQDVPLAHVMAVDDDDEAAMLKMAIDNSLNDKRDRAAAAAEARASRAISTRSSGLPLVDVDDSAAMDEDSPLSGEEDEDEDEGEAASTDDGEGSGAEGGGFIAKKGSKKAKQTVKSKKPKKESKAEKRRREALERNPGAVYLKQERQKLGRKLTHAERTNVLLRVNHPELRDVWGDLERVVKPVTPEKAEQPKDLKATLLPFQQESLFWMRKQEQGIWKGGCLADEMGMGKTIQTLALLSSDRTKPNLIIAPTVAIMQWKNEIDLHTEGFKVVIYHGQARTKDSEELSKADVVLTTYAVLESVFRKQHSGFTRKGVILKEKSILHNIHWRRIVLDEAHNIKERSCNTAKAAFELKSDFKWCLSGTPLQNRVGELYSLIRFLGGDPFSFYFCKNCSCKSLHWSFKDKRHCDDCGHSPMQHTCFWNNEILTPIQKHAMTGPGQAAFKKLKILLDRMMLRRTKLERADDLGLPPRTVIVRRDYFSPEEKELYLSLFSDAKRQFSTYVGAGTLLNNYSNIFSLITRMRQMACHPDLVLKSRTNTALSGDIVEATVCRLCNDIAEDAIKSKCHHVFDRECIKQYMNVSGTTPTCPVCHVDLTIDLDAPALEQDEKEVQRARQGILGRLDIDSWRSSSKIEALVEELTNLRREDRTTKSIVFSQFVNFLDLIAWRLQRAGFNICRLEGTMTPQARDLTIKHFMNNVEVTVFLVSLKAGGVALNLVEASRVYLMDSWWNPAVEFQAMDRIHRLGQHRPVQAIKLVIEDSIESRIVQLQEKKSAMVDATLSSDDSAMGRLTPEDLGFLFRL